MMLIFGTVKSKTVKIARGKDPNKTYGLDLPQRDLVISLIAPAIGSVQASMILVTSIKTVICTVGINIKSVKKRVK